LSRLGQAWAGVGRQAGAAGGALQGAVDGGPEDLEDRGDFGDGVVAAVVHAADLVVLGGARLGGLAAQFAPDVDQRPTRTMVRAGSEVVG